MRPAGAASSRGSSTSSRSLRVNVPQKAKSGAGPEGRHRSTGAGGCPLGRGSDVRADLREDRADARAQEDQGRNGDDGDEGKDECVLGKTLPLLLAEDAGQPGHEVS